MKRILVVDDDPQFLHSVGRMLTSAGYEVEEVGNGRLALERCRENPSDLVLLDIHMPEVDGVEAIIRLSQELPKLQVIATSGGGQVGTADALEVMRALGAARTLAKPFGRDELLAVVEDVLRDD